MKLKEEQKLAIKNEYESWFENQYGNSTKEERDKLGAIYTPPDITIAMIEKLNNLDGKILDPCCGTGNLLAGCILAGADPNNIYGNEYEEQFMLLARQRLGKLGVPDWHIHRGNALQAKCLTEFSPEYETDYQDKYIDDLEYAQCKYKLIWEEENNRAAARWENTHTQQLAFDFSKEFGI